MWQISRISGTVRPNRHILTFLGQVMNRVGSVVILCWCSKGTLNIKLISTNMGEGVGDILIWSKQMFITCPLYQNLGELCQLARRAQNVSKNLIFCSDAHFTLFWGPTFGQLANLQINFSQKSLDKLFWKCQSQRHFCQKF